MVQGPKCGRELALAQWRASTRRNNKARKAHVIPSSSNIKLIDEGTFTWPMIGCFLRVCPLSACFRSHCWRPRSSCKAAASPIFDFAP
jgi:hypothetical protein